VISCSYWQQRSLAASPTSQLILFNLLHCSNENDGCRCVARWLCGSTARIMILLASLISILGIVWQCLSAPSFLTAKTPKAASDMDNLPMLLLPVFLLGILFILVVVVWRSLVASSTVISNEEEPASEAELCQAASEQMIQEDLRQYLQVTIPQQDLTLPDFVAGSKFDYSNFDHVWLLAKLCALSYSRDYDIFKKKFAAAFYDDIDNKPKKFKLLQQPNKIRRTWSEIFFE